jgi:hypothetical protein
MQTWKFNGTDTWVKLASNSPAWSDAVCWCIFANYSTIQTAIVKDELYLLARSDQGMVTWKFNGTDSWIKLVPGNAPAWSDAAGWDDVANYSTIQTAVVKDELYLLARADQGMVTWKFNGTDSWIKLVPGNAPAWSDAVGWDDIANYSTIQTAVVKDELYLLARGDRGMQTWKLNVRQNGWHKVVSNTPAWADVVGWDDAANYSTIQTAVVKDKLYLLARADKGMHTWKLDHNIR